MRSKVARLSSSDTLIGSQTVIRNLAKEGLMEDGKEELLARKLKLPSNALAKYLLSRALTCCL